jgi:hypothetical protein
MKKILIGFIVGLLVSGCSQRSELPSGLPMELGDVEFNNVPEETDRGLYYSFTTTSRVGESSKPGILAVREPEGVVRGTAVFFSGGTGTGWAGTDTMTSDALAAGYRTVHVKWDTGWFVGTPDANEGFQHLAVHPATITDFVKKQFAQPDKPFVLWGSSGGAAQIAFMLSFYGIDRITDSAIISGGFWMGRIDIGCLDEDPLNAYLHYSENARKSIDLSFGFERDTPGPCELKDESFAEQLKESSAAFGGNYNYPDTAVYLLYGGSDSVGALNQGLLYHEQLVAHGSPHIHMQVVDGAPHGLHRDPNGYAVTMKILLAQLTTPSIHSTADVQY